MEKSKVIKQMRFDKDKITPLQCYEKCCIGCPFKKTSKGCSFEVKDYMVEQRRKIKQWQKLTK